MRRSASASPRRLRADAAATLQRLRDLGLEVHLLSGDQPRRWRRSPRHSASPPGRPARTPVQKVAAIEALVAPGRKVLMVGDGLNDSPSLAAASVSASPATAADISQTVADVVFQGNLLAPVAAVIETARRARAVMRQNLALSIGYNVLMVPLAVAGFVTPWLAAAAMSSSSLLVMANSFRLRGRARMNVILYLLGASLFLGGGGLAVFLWSLRSGQYDDLEGAANRILFDDEER